MLRSMTGFGRGEAGADSVSVVVELRSVNHRFLDVQARLPREYLALEPSVQAAIKARCSRGRVEAHVRRQGEGGGATVRADGPLFDATVAAMRTLIARAGGTTTADPVVLALGQPGVLAVVADDVDAAAEAGLVVEAVDGALDRLVAMREQEGGQLAAELGRQLDALEAETASIAAVASDLSERQRARIAARVEALLGEPADPARLAQEVALLAEKADIQEEIVRLGSHVAQARATLLHDEPVGRRLEFLLQEMGREVNTIGSKTVDHPISASVVTCKAVLERMREQAANVE